MATFRCNNTGNTVDFDLEWDIEQMRSHPDYTEVKEEEKKPEVKVKKSVIKSTEE
jgi:D-alanyl-D-alanine dipeptidase